MTLLEHALELVKRGLPIFPLLPNTKLPAIKDFPNRATMDRDQVIRWWKENPNYNMGISTEHFVAIDIDNKGAKRGSDELIRLELEGKHFPDTYEQTTPTGGKHLLYSVSSPSRNTAGDLGKGIDTRGKGGYIVGAGSILDGKAYSGNDKPVVAAPTWLIELLGKPRDREVDSPSSRRAVAYLKSEAPLSKEGEGGDHTAFVVACRLKDLGLNRFAALDLMLTHWNDRCEPAWSPEELETKVTNAYRYGKEPIGSATPEVQFEPVVPAKELSPLDRMNQRFAYIASKHGFVMEEMKPRAVAIDLSTFHTNLLPETISFGNRTQQISKVWLASPERRSYLGIEFNPRHRGHSKTHFNLWQGFSVEPKSPSPRDKACVDAFVEHSFENVCNGDQALHHWLMSYFAHLVQRPWEKPQVALVMKGKKGVGKNALVERVGRLLGDHFAVFANRRYLLSNFNSILENKLMLVLDEAFWSGDKAAEGVLKDLITGEYHQIEQKGKEPYPVKNCLRVVILGNEEWIVPTTEEERRFAVFNVGDGRRQDRKFFRAMREDMEAGGYAYLLRYLLDYEIGEADVTAAPNTKGLLEQKESSLAATQQWWLSCISEGRILGSEFSNWPTEISKDRLRNALYEHLKRRGIHTWLPTPEAVTKQLTRCAPSLISRQIREEGERLRKYILPTLQKAREEWDAFMNFKRTWEPINDEEEDIFS